MTQTMPRNTVKVVRAPSTGRTPWPLAFYRSAVGKKWVVEHWFPSAEYPAGRPVVGIARRQP